MNDYNAVGGGLDHPRAALSHKEMTFKRYKEISDLSFKIKAFVDKEVKDLTSSEACMLGDKMQRIINLK